jgi:hypothetical protein
MRMQKGWHAYNFSKQKTHDLNRSCHYFIPHFETAASLWKGWLSA